MMTSIRNLSMAAAAILFAAACNAPAPEPSATPPTSAEQPAAPAPPKPPVSINAVMVALIDHAGHNLWDVEQEGKAPKSDAAWATVEEHAVQIAAAGPAISIGGTGPRDEEWVKSPSWIAHARRMSEAGVAAMNAATSKNFDALVKANGQLVEACEACHKEFKPDLPSEGIHHTHVH